MKVKNCLSQIFNWKTNPEGVWCVVIPLAALCLILQGLHAFFLDKVSGGHWAMAIYIVAVISAGFLFRKLYQDHKKLKAQFDELKTRN